MTVPVGRLVLGCAPLGNLFTAVSDDIATATIDAAWDLGLRTFDTAPLYGHGLSELRLGRALAGRPRHEFTVCTKVGRVLEDGIEETSMFAEVPPQRPRFDFSGDGVRRSIEASLNRLGLDRLDIVHVHDPDDHIDEALDGAYPALAALVDEGVVGAVGLGTNTVAVAERVLRAADLDHLLMAGRITLLDRTGLAGVVPLAARLGVEVLAAGVFNSGVLADPRPGAFFHYAEASETVIETARHLHVIAADHGTSLIAAAVQYPLRFPGVTRVVVGARSPDEVVDDVRAASVSLSDGLWEALDGVPDCT